MEVKAQEEGKAPPTLENLQRRYEYYQSDEYQGPSTSKHLSPSSISQSKRILRSTNNSRKYQGRKNTITYSPRQIDRRRQLRGGGGGFGTGQGGTKEADPKMGKPEPIKFDSQKTDPNLHVDPPGRDVSFLGPGFWKTLLIIVLALLVFLLAYYLIKNYRPRNRKVEMEFVPEDLNPEEIPKSELERRLEEAMAREDYRECVRIYFTFILKELIRLRRIRWKKELTNRDYVIQMSRRKDGRENFEESVRIYDLIWYGNYSIGRSDYSGIEGKLKSYYERLSTEHV
ncbi:MAG: hypothetical protein EP338_03300 [Bacteroidetes bacterium]|nr:MAG: hypothetical protein EP338_03300 [Bacteroidota bacterium]